MLRFRRSTLFTALGTCLLVPMLAAAQDAPPATTTTAGNQQAQTLDAVSVVGIRGSLEASRDLKRDSPQIVDAIVADDIGKLPDTNVAESLGRVAGVQLERGMGEGSDILVRGLKENVLLYNGRQIVDATGRGGNGLDQLATSTYGLLSLVPSELISRLEVTKLAGADQISGGLGGIVDIHTRQPLSGDSDQNVVSLAGTYDDMADSWGHNAFGLISRRNEDRTFGALLSATYGRRNVVQQGLDTFSGYARFNDPTDPTRTRFGSTDMRAQNIDDDRTKVGLSAVLQWRPADGVELSWDTFYSRQKAERDRYWIAFNPSAGLSNAVYSDHDILLAGRSTGTVLLNTEVADIDSDTLSSALRASFQVGERVTGSAELDWGRSTASYNQRYMRLAPMAGLTSVTDFDLRSGSFGSFNVSGVNVVDPSQWRMTILFDNDWRAQTDSRALRTDWSLAFDNGPLRSLDVGARFSRLESLQDPRRADIRPAGGIPVTQMDPYIHVYSNNDFLPGEFAGLPRDYLGAFRGTFGGCGSFTTLPQISQNPQCLDPANTALAYSATFSVDEDFLEAYAKLNWDTEVGGMALGGNVGLRFVGRDLTSRGNLISGTGALGVALGGGQAADQRQPGAARRRGQGGGLPQYRRPQQRRDPQQQRRVRCQRRADFAGHRQRRRTGPGSVQGHPVRPVAGVVLRRPGPALGRPVLQGRVHLHRAAPERGNLQQRQLPGAAQDQRRQGQGEGRGAVGAGALQRHVRWLRRGGHLHLDRLGNPDHRHQRQRHDVPGPVQEQRQPDRLLRERPVRHPPGLQLA